MGASKSSLSDPPSLPHDLIIEILSRLPVRSLVQFCCVCKSWKNLIISDRFFARFHLQKNSTNSSNDKNYPCARKNVLIKPISAIQYIAQEINYACGDSRSCRLVFAIDDFNLGGCCDGIICFYVFGHGNWDTNLMIYLCNPALNQLRVLPKSNFQSKMWYPSVGTKVCFIYDPTSEDYKVIIIGTWLKTLVTVEIYSLNSNSWREFIWDTSDQGYHHIACDSDLVVHNGSPCWLTESAHGANNKVLNVLDITQDRIRVIPLPESLSTMLSPSLQRYKGSLAISSWPDSRDELWVMKEDKVGDSSWVKQVIRSNSPCLTRSALEFWKYYFWGPHCRTPWATTTRAFLEACGSTVFMGDVENERLEECTAPTNKLLNGFSSKFFVAVDYVPSLFSIMLPTSQPNSNNDFIQSQIFDG